MRLITQEDKSNPVGWLKLPWINNADVARCMGMSRAHFINKRDNKQYKKFSEEELHRLSEIRARYINDMLMWG